MSESEVNIVDPTQRRATGLRGMDVLAHGGPRRPTRRLAGEHARPASPSATLLICAMVLLGITSAAHAATDLTLRLVRSDAPDQLVSTAITKIDVEAERARKLAEAQDAANNPALVKDNGVVPQAEFDHYSNYMRGIVIDATHNFYREYKGSFLGRSDVIHLSLEDGEHVINPGAHRFTLAGGKAASSDPTLKIAGTTIDIQIFPVTVMAVDGSAIRKMPAEVRRLPVSARLYWNAEELLPKEENLAPGATFKRLTLYMLANAQGAGYRVSPSDRQFYVTPGGIVVLDEAGKPASDSASLVEGKFTLVLPQRAVPIRIVGGDVNVLIAGPAGRLAIPPSQKPERDAIFYAFPASGGALITVGHRASNQPMPLPGDFDRFPRRKIVVDSTSPVSKEPRVMSVSMSAYSADAGKTLAARVQLLDALDAPTLSPAQVQAYIWKTPVLGEDGWLNALAPDAPDEGWTAVRVEAGTEPDIYKILLPVDLPASVYRLRLVADRRGECSPRSALHADFVTGVINPSAPANVSIFCPSGRHSFAAGAEVPISVVARGTSAIAAGKLRVVLKRGGDIFPLADRDVAEQPAGSHPFHWRLAGTATAALAPGDYTIEASLGKMVSNAWSLRIVRPRWNNPFPIHCDSRFSANSIDLGMTFKNVPKDIAEANEARKILRRNAELLGWQFDTAASDWYIFTTFADYVGRDSSSEIAEVEAVLRENDALPAHEVYYYQNHWEACNEALASQGIGHVNGVHCAFSPNSLIHSIQKEVDSDLRKYELIAQIGQKFENFRGMALLYPNSAPLGDPELGDNDRGVRMQTLEKNFVAKYGFRPPAMSDASRAMEAFLAGKSTAETREIARRYEAWVYNYNCLEKDHYQWAKEVIAPINPAVRCWNVGPGWGFAASGTYPALANANSDPQEVWTGFSDYGWELIFEDMCRPRFNQMAQNQVYSVISTTLTAGAKNNKNHLAGQLAAATDGFGYMGGPVVDPTSLAEIFQQEEFRDIRDIVRAYGPMFKQVRNKAEIGLVFPLHQSMYEDLKFTDPRWNKNDSFYSCYSAMMHLAFLGYNCEVVTEQMIDEGKLDRYKLLLLPAQHYLLPEHVAAIEKFAAAGKPVLVGANSTLVPKGARKIEDDFSELHESDMKWGNAYPLDDAHAWIFGEMLRKTAKLRETLDPIFKPFAQATTMRVLVQTNQAGQGHYTYVWDMSYPSWMGTTRVSGNTQGSAFGGEANERTLMPLKEIVSFSPGGVTYDLFTQRPLASQPGKDGRTEGVCDLSMSPFRVFITLPKAIAAIRVEAPAALTLGQSTPIRITPLDADGAAIDAAIPLRLQLFDAAGKSVTEMPASALKTFVGELGVPLGFQPGDWKLIVKELVSGRQVETTLKVSAPAVLPFGSAMADVPAVDVQRGDLIRSFIDARRKDGQAVFLVLDESQYVGRLPMAKEVVKQLLNLGVKAEIHKTSDPGVYASTERVHLFKGWEEMQPSQFVDHHLVLIGGEGESVLLEEIQQAGLLVRPLTADYPGPGRAVLALVRSPFAFGRDVLCLLGPDDAGLSAAIKTLGALSAPPADVSVPAAPKLVAHEAQGAVSPGSPFATMDGCPIQCISVAGDGKSIGFGALGYARNCFVFDLDGNLKYEDKIGHVNTLDMKLSQDGKRMLVASDRSAYLRDADGAVKWRLRSRGGRDPVIGSPQTFHHDNLILDPAGRYVATTADGTISVYDLALKPLWKFDEFDQYETSKEILFGRKANLLAVLDHGDTLAYRLSGKAPGAAGEFGDDLIFREALTGKEKRRVPIAIDAAALAAGAAPEQIPPLDSWVFYQNGDYSILTFTVRPNHVDVLLDKDLKLITAEHFDIPPYVGGSREKTNRHLLPDRRLVFTVGDTLCITDPKWSLCESVRMTDLILSLKVDETRRRIAISDYSGRVSLFDYSLKPVGHAELDSAAVLEFLPDGRVAAGTMRGTAALLDSAGQTLWSKSINRYADPQDVEKRWAELEALPGPETGTALSWWEQVAKNVPLGKDVANLSGRVTAATPLTANCEGSAFATYLVEWKHRRTAGHPQLSLEISELESAVDESGKPIVGAAPIAVRRVMASAQPRENESIDRALLRLGDRPQSVRILMQSAGDGDADASLSVRQLTFPSDDLIRVPGLYRGQISEAVRANPPVTIDMFFNVFEKGSPHVARWADPFDLVNGRMMENEPGLLRGKWFGSGISTRMESIHAEIPCYVELNMPRKRVITHIVIAEDPALARAEAYTVDAYIESRETRKGLSDFEKRQLKRGFWTNVVKVRGNSNAYNVYKLEKPIFASKLRIYVLGGFSAIDEIELYGALPESLKPKPATQPSPEHETNAK
ncbi:MAG TPA: hypothetical protein VG326_20680 [Tepidisphaeraceae bacterium]|nr:hypothetical protein [Tepidisphaeraceae bacterium]